MEEIFYYYDEPNKIIYWSTELKEDRPEYVFLGSSLNPNKKMAAAAFTHKFKQPKGHRIVELV